MRLLPALSITMLLLAGYTEAREYTFKVLDQASGQPVSDAVLMAGSPPANPLESEIVQQHRAFHPGVLVVPRNSVVHFPNRDNTQHHVYSFSPAKTFDIELYADRPEAPITFDKTGVVELGCNIHDHMRGFIVVTDQGVWSRSNEQGITILDLPQPVAEDRPVSVQLWHPRLADNTRTVSVLVDFSREEPLELSLELLPASSAGSPMEALQNRFEGL